MTTFLILRDSVNMRDSVTFAILQLPRDSVFSEKPTLFSRVWDTLCSESQGSPGGRRGRSGWGVYTRQTGPDSPGSVVLAPAAIRVSGIHPRSEPAGSERRWLPAPLTLPRRRFTRWPGSCGREGDEGRVLGGRFRVPVEHVPKVHARTEADRPEAGIARKSTILYYPGPIPGFQEVPSSRETPADHRRLDTAWRLPCLSLLGFP